MLALLIKRKKSLHRLLGITTEARSGRPTLCLFITAQAPPRERIGTQRTAPIVIIFEYEREAAMGTKMHDFHDATHEIDAEKRHSAIKEHCGSTGETISQ